MLWRNTRSKATYRRKHLSGCLLTVWKDESMTHHARSMVAGRLEQGESLHLIYKLEVKKQTDRHWTWHGLLKPQSSHPVNTPHPTIPHPFFLNSPLPGNQTFKSMSLWGHSHSNCHNHPTSPVVVVYKLVSFIFTVSVLLLQQLNLFMLVRLWMCLTYHTGII